jgi:hypothetical protein
MTSDTPVWISRLINVVIFIVIPVIVVFGIVMGVLAIKHHDDAVRARSDAEWIRQFTARCEALKAEVNVANGDWACIKDHQIVYR